MRENPKIICIGSVLWDVIGRSERTMRAGSDMPGRITRIPGGVAMNIAMTLRRFGHNPALLSVVGNDPEGDQLMQAAGEIGLDTSYIYRTAELPTDVYMAIEGANGLIAAIADAHSLERAGDRILAPLTDGRLGHASRPFSGVIALDGNLTTEMLGQIANDPAFEGADLRVAPASPGKAERLRPLMRMPNATLYVNLEEACLLTNAAYHSATEAAGKMIEQGAKRVVVTNGASDAVDASHGEEICAAPPKVTAKRITGAGDTFMAAHITAELQGMTKRDAMSFALNAAATYVSGQDTL